jgi:hypothetical protein
MPSNTITVSIYDDKGVDLVFQGQEVGKFDLFENDQSSLKLSVSIYADHKQYYAQIIARNLGHSRSGVCHSSARHSLAPLEQREILVASTLLMLAKKIKKTYPRVEMDGHFLAIIREQLGADSGLEP